MSYFPSSACIYTEVEHTGQTAILVRWVVTEKVKDGKLFTIARLVAHGFEENTECL